MTEKSLHARAVALQERAEAARSAPILTKMSEADKLVGEIATFIVDLAAAVDAVTPYLDEEGAANE